MTSLTVISWHLTGDVIKKGQKKVQPWSLTYIFRSHLQNQKRNSDPQTVLTIPYSELKISLTIHKNVCDSKRNEAKVYWCQIYPS